MPNKQKKRLHRVVYQSHHSQPITSYNPIQQGMKNAPQNGAILVLSSIMDQVLSSTMEVEIGAAFYVAKEAVALRTTLVEMGHKQLSTLMECDNQC